MIVRDLIEILKTLNSEAEVMVAYESNIRADVDHVAIGTVEEADGDKSVAVILYDSSEERLKDFWDVEKLIKIA